MSSEPSGAGARPNEWLELLRPKAAPTSSDLDCNVIVLGDPKNGKGDLFRGFAGGHTSAEEQRRRDYFLEHAYCEVPQVSSDRDGPLAHANIWEFDNPTHAAALLPPLLERTRFKRIVYVVTFDLSLPGLIGEALDRWLDVLAKAHEAAFGKLDEGTRSAMRRAISSYNKFFVDAAQAEAEGGPAEARSVPKPGVAVDEGVPRINLGVPLLLVGCKSDKLGDIFNAQKTSGDRFVYLSERLRKRALEYGAAVLYTTSTRRQDKRSRTVGMLRDYVYHRLYDRPLVHPACVVEGKDVETRYDLFVPAGFDTEQLISLIQPAQPSWAPGSDFKVVFPAPAGAAQPSPSAASATAAAAAPGAPGSAPAEPEVVAEADDAFLRALDFSIRNNSSMPLTVKAKGPAASPASPEPAAAAGAKADSSADATKARAKSSAGKDDGAVRSFFENLLASKGSAGGATDGNKGDVKDLLRTWKGDKDKEKK